MYDAIVLAGGTGRRLGGVDKAALEMAGRPLLTRVLAAVAEAGRTVVVGPARDLPVGVVGTSEHPPGGGPVAGLAAGLSLVEAPLVVVLACDLPFVTAPAVRSLVETLGAGQAGADGDERGGTSGADGAWFVDEDGRAQPLTAIYRTAPLRAAIAELSQLTNTPMRDVVARLTMLAVEAGPGPAWDCDTWADVIRARERLARHPWEEA